MRFLFGVVEIKFTQYLGTGVVNGICMHGFRIEVCAFSDSGADITLRNSFRSLPLLGYIPNVSRQGRRNARLWHHEFLSLGVGLVGHNLNISSISPPLQPIPTEMAG